MIININQYYSHNVSIRDSFSDNTDTDLPRLIVGSMAFGTGEAEAEENGEFTARQTVKRRTRFDKNPATENNHRPISKSLMVHE